MTDNLRIHIVPIGYDTTRVTEPLISKKADRAYFIRHRGDEESSYYDYIKRELDGKGIEIREEFVDIWNLFECIQKFKEIVRRDRGNHFYVNVSTGSKITAMAGMLTSMLTSDVEPYYVHIVYSPQKIKKEIKGDTVRESSELPVFGINQPPEEYLAVLELLDEQEGMKKSRLIGSLEERRIIEQRDTSKTEFSEHAKHSQLRAMLDPMERVWKFVKIEGKGKKSRVRRTPQGSFALEMFGKTNV